MPKRDTKRRRVRRHRKNYTRNMKGGVFTAHETQGLLAMGFTDSNITYLNDFGIPYAYVMQKATAYNDQPDLVDQVMDEIASEQDASRFQEIEGIGNNFGMEEEEGDNDMEEQDNNSLQLYELDVDSDYGYTSSEDDDDVYLEGGKRKKRRRIKTRKHKKSLRNKKGKKTRKQLKRKVK